MSKWEEKRLEDIIDVNPPVKLKKGESYPFIDIDKVSPTRCSVTNEEVKVYDGQSSSKFCDGDTVFSRITPCLENRKIAKVAIEGDAAFGSTEFYVFRAKKKKADARFTYYLTSSDAVVLPAINSMTGASGRQRADKRFIQRLKLNLPDLPTQERIADILSAYDDLIEANNRRIELLEQTAQELYKEWFVRFRFPGYENAKFEDGIPEGWDIKRIVDLFDITSSKRVYLADYVDAGIPFYRSKEIIQLSQGQAITEPLYISNAAYENFKSKYGAPEKNDILITSVGTIGVSYLVDGHEFYFKDGNLTWIKSGSNKALSLFLFQWLNSQSGKQQLLQSTIGTSQSALTIENLKKIKLLVPTKALIEDYYQKAHFMLEQKSALQMNNRNLAVQRDMLLPRMMSGKLEV
ncbi:MAG: restriction endonuclease subunit S [Coprococcus eutactus]